MRWIRLVLVLVVVGSLVGCTPKDVHVLYPAPPETPVGTLVLRLTDAADITVAVNGMLVVDDVNTQRITIENVPTGTAEVTIAANGGDKQFRAWIDSEHPTTVPLGVPTEGGSFLKSLAGTLITIVAYTLLR